MQPLQTTTNFWLVGLSVLTSIIASYAAFSFAERVATAKGSRLFLWLSGGAFAMGLGIWSMHSLGMMSVQLPVEVLYHVPTVLLSLLLAVLASGVALAVMSQAKLGWGQITLGSLLMGSGIGGMHYTGMRSMRSSAMHHYNPGLVMLSVLVAVAFSWMALKIAFSVRTEKGGREWIRVFAASLMGSGIAAMHYTAQAAITFMPSSMSYSTEYTMRMTSLVVLSVAMTSALVLLGAMMAALMDRKKYDQIEKTNQQLLEARTALLLSEQALRDINAHLAELSIRDGLTGVYNRRHFDDSLDGEWRRAVRTKQAISLLLVDVDHFKKLNDRFGHPAGDDCLRAIAACLGEVVRRPGDIVSRYGGEEFAVILPGTDLIGALQVAEGMRLGIQALKGFSWNSPVGTPVTISIGVCCQEPASGESAVAMIVAADQALYRAKEGGRNRVHSAASILEVLGIPLDGSDFSSRPTRVPRVGNC